MRPIVISCHTRPVSVVRFNRDGDLFFTGSLDGMVCVYWTEPVERLGTYTSEGAVKSFSVTEDSKIIIVGSAINGIFVFEVETGRTITVLPALQVKQVEFAAGSKSFFVIHTHSRNTIVDIFQTSAIEKSYKDLEYENAYVNNEKRTLVKSDTVYTKGAWGMLNKTLVLGTNKGAIDVFDLETNVKAQTFKPHFDAITDLRFAPDFSLLISSSRDCFCNVYDPQTMKVVRTYNAQRPLNSAVISPLIVSDLKYHAVIGGGQETRDVTTTKAEVSSK
jgi:translation initiation factor 3 subunit I